MLSKEYSIFEVPPCAVIVISVPVGLLQLFDMSVISTGSGSVISISVFLIIHPIESVTSTL